MLLVAFFFFKQKTAYEMRISDWSSDVCSSDLIAIDVSLDPGNCFRYPSIFVFDRSTFRTTRFVSLPHHRHHFNKLAHVLNHFASNQIHLVAQLHHGRRFVIDTDHIRSEEHTSELQSLMRISYAVFCLKKKKQK